MYTEISEEEKQDISRDYFGPGTTIRQHLEQRGDFNQWIIDGVLCDSVTFVVGKPESGKSRFLANLVARLSTGKEFLNLPFTRINPRPWHVLVIGTEFNLVAEWSQRIIDLEGDIDRVAVEQVPASGNIPQDIYERARGGAIDLVVIDNAGGFTDPTEGANSDISVSNLKRVIQPFNESRIPVVVIHHTNKQGQSMQGSVQYQAMARHTLHIAPAKNGVQKITRSGNLGSFAPLSVRVADNGVELLPIGGQEPSTATPKALSEEQLKIIELACQQPEGLSKAEIGRRVAKEILANPSATEEEIEHKGKSIATQLHRFVSSEGSTLQWDNESKKYTNT